MDSASVWLRAALIASALAMLAGCTTAPLPEGAAAEACYARMTARQIGFERLTEIDDRNGCAVPAALRMSHGGIAWSRPGVVTCGFAERLVDFETAVVQPLAMELFRQPVRKLHHMGTYSCRRRSGSLVTDKLSEHAFGRAIDIRSFELADGTTIEVRRHWAKAGKKSEFLQTLARRACDQFAVVLTPNHNYAHRDHLHLDSGPYRLCGL